MYICIDMNTEKKYLIGGGLILAYLLFKFTKYQISKAEWFELNKNNKISLPLKGSLRISSSYGQRGNDFHNGVDLTFKNTSILGAPIYAPLAGTVTSNAYNNLGGNQVILDCGYAKFGFAHLKDKSPLAVGSKIAQGSFIGYVGNTGYSFGPHLHFTLRLNNVVVDPVSNIQVLKNALS